MNKMTDSDAMKIISMNVARHQDRSPLAEALKHIAARLHDEAQAEERARLLEALRGLYDELERDHYGADYAPEPDEPMGIAKAALATQRKEPGA